MLFLKRRARIQAEQILSHHSISRKDLRRLRFCISKGQFDGRSFESGFFGILYQTQTDDRNKIMFWLGIRLGSADVPIELYCREIYRGGRLAGARAKNLRRWVEKGLEHKKEISRNLNAEIHATQEIIGRNTS
jgi:hypothetical protein